MRQKIKWGHLYGCTMGILNLINHEHFCGPDSWIWQSWLVWTSQVLCPQVQTCERKSRHLKSALGHSITQIVPLHHTPSLQALFPIRVWLNSKICPQHSKYTHTNTHGFPLDPVFAVGAVCWWQWVDRWILTWLPNSQKSLKGWTNLSFTSDKAKKSGNSYNCKFVVLQAQICSPNIKIQFSCMISMLSTTLSMSATSNCKA